MKHLNPASDYSLPPIHQLRVIVVKWDRVAAEAIRRVVTKCFPETEVMTCHSGGDALAALRKQSVQLALLGLTLPDIDGLDVLTAIGAERLAVRQLIVSSRRDERSRELVRNIRLNGWFDPTCDDSRALQNAIRTVINGRSYFSSVSSASPTNGDEAPLGSLTEAEMAVFAVVGGGCDQQRAADRLGVSKNTVHTHLEHIMSKLGVRTCLDVMCEALRRGVVRIMTDGRVLYPGMEHVLATRAQRATRTGQRANGSRGAIAIARLDQK